MQHTPSVRTLRDDFNDTDSISPSDIQHHYGRNSPGHRGFAAPAASAASAQAGRSPVGSNRFKLTAEDKGKGKEKAWPSSFSPRGHTLSGKQPASTLTDSAIQRLPVEALGQVFARLPPASLLACSLVCHDWYDLINQDSTWRSAFLYHFSLDENFNGVPGNRLSNESWQAEFIKRHALAQKWSKSKVSTITHDPRVGNISLIHADIALERHATSRNPAWRAKQGKDSNTHGNAPSMVSVSIPRGTASRSDPFSGKVAKGGFIEGAPMPAFIAGLGGNLDTVTTAAVSKDGNILAWGMANGSLHLSRTGLGGRYIHGQGQRAAAPAPVGTPMQNHMGPVTLLCFVDATEYIVTAATDGVVKLWEPSAGCIWSSASMTQVLNGRPDEIEVLTARTMRLSANLATVSIGTQTGLIFVWTIDLKNRSTLDHRRVDPVYTARDALLPVNFLSLDPSKSALLVQYYSEPCFYRVEWQNEGEPQVTAFGHHEGHIGSICAIKTIFPEESKPLNITGGVTSINGQETPLTPNTTQQQQQEKSLMKKTFGGLSYVIAGDDQGRTFMWDWAGELGGQNVILPFRQLQGFETKVTSIEVTDLLILIGTADGMVRAYDLLSGKLVRIFNERSAPRQALRHLLNGQADADEEAKWAVNQIVASREGFVASIGARILAWRAGDDSKARKKTPRTGGRLSSRAERYRTEMELKQDIRESTAVLDSEHSDRMARLSEYRSAQDFAGIPRSLGDMTDEEALALALMMSREEEEQRQASLAEDTTFDDLEDDLDHLRLEEEENDEDEEVSDVASRASSRGLGSSRAPASRFAGQSEWQPRSFEFTGSLPASPYMRPSLSPLSSSARSHSKIQVSPRLNPHLYASPRSPSPVPDLNEVSEWPLPSPASTGAAPIAIQTSTGSPVASPSPRLGKSSWSAAAQSGGSPRLSSSTPGLDATGNSGSRGLAWKARSSPAPVPVLASSAAASADDEDMDDELRFVLELSRAEEESRQAAARMSE